MTATICLENATKVFRRGWRRESFLAVDRLSLAVEEGEVFGFVGPNGAGKSTTIKLLTGLLSPTSGAVWLFGKKAGDPSGRKGLGYVPENPSLSEHLTPLEILTMALRLHEVRVRDEREHCMKWLDRFDIARVATKPVRSFSKGMMQRTALAQALVIGPRLLILDEPLSGLDPIGRKDVVDILAEYRRGGGALFLTSHVLHDVERLADRFGLIHKGVLHAVGSPSQLTSDDDLVLVRSQGVKPIDAMTEELRGRWFAEVHRSQLWPLMEALRQAGHELIEVKPALSLEAAFMRIVRQE